MSAEYKVVTYTDHKKDDDETFFDNYEDALKFWRNRIISQKIYAEFTASAAIIRVSTGEPIHRQTWRVG